MTFNLARAIGPASAAGVIAVFGLPWAFALNSCSYLVLVVGLLMVHPRDEERAARASLRDSLALLRADPQARDRAADRDDGGLRLRPDEHRVARLRARVRLLGYVGGHDRRRSSAPGRLPRRCWSRAVSPARAADGGRRWQPSGSGVLLFSLAPWLPLGFAFLALAGFGYLGSNTAATTRLQLGVSPSQRGRIMALWSIAFLGLRPVASLADGALAGAFGVRTAGVVPSLPALAGAALAASSWRRRVSA